MIRGITLFICTECKKVFWAPDPIFQLLAYPVYKGIWETMEREKIDKNDYNENR